MEAKIQAWSSKILSQASKMVLNKSVLSSLPIYQMGCFLIPKKITTKINAIQRDFWWGKKVNAKGIRIKSYPFMCKPVSQGGLGFKDANKTNLAMLAKLAWRLLENPNSLMASLLKPKYFKNNSALVAKVPKSSSWMWKCISKGLVLIKQNNIWEVGDGKSINLWFDNWIPGLDKNLSEMGLPINTNLTLVADLIDCNNKWNLITLQSCFPSVIISKILNINLFCNTDNLLHKDRIRWKLTRDGNFTVKSMYAKLNDPSMSLGSNEHSKTFWKKIWNLKVSQRIKLFIWKCLNNALPVNDTLSRYTRKASSRCIFCETEDETMEHLFSECHFAKSILMLPPCPSLLSVHSNASFKEHFCSWMNGVAQGISAEFAATKCWFIWKERCNRVFRDKASSSITTSLTIQRHIQFWTPRAELLNPNVLFPRVVNTLHNQPQWAAPGLNELKVNVDAAWKLDANSNTGVAIVVRNHAGTMEGARAGPKSTSSAEEAEAVATLKEPIGKKKQRYRHLALQEIVREWWII